MLAFVVHQSMRLHANCRRRNSQGGYLKKRLGTADDAGDADGVVFLSYKQAQDRGCESICLLQCVFETNGSSGYGLGRASGTTRAGLRSTIN